MIISSVHLSSAGKSLPYKRAMLSALGIACAVAFPLHAPAVEPVVAATLTKVQKSDPTQSAAERLDMQKRFAHGVTLAQAGKIAEAIPVFVALTEDYPDTPEPYNNLAVLYAATGQDDRARVALTAAIMTNPAIRVAHGNLGDLYAKMASQAYDKAFDLEGGGQGPKAKLTLLPSITSTDNNSIAPANAPANSIVAAAVAPATAQPAETQSDKKVEEPKPSASAPDVLANSNTNPAAPILPLPPSPSKLVGNDAVCVLAAVDEWAQAWRDRDAELYLQYYSQDFETPNGEPLEVWAQERAQRLRACTRIAIAISDTRVIINEDIDANIASVMFRQLYESDTIRSDSQKTLVLTNISGEWLIKKEWASV